MKQEIQNYFAELSAINVSEHIEKKGQFSYLSWPYAVSQLRLFDHAATWEVQRFNGLPYLQTDNGTFVEVAVTVQGVTLSQLHPVLDADNRPMMAPTSFDINTSIQRCLVKAIALHGLGLNIYAGEDLPNIEGSSQQGKAARTSPALKAISGAEPLLTANQLRYIKKLITDTDTDEAELLGFFEIESLDHIPKSQVNRIIRLLESKRDKKAA